MGRAITLLSLFGILAGGAALISGLSGEDESVALAGGLVAAGSLPWLVGGLALSGHSKSRDVQAKDPGRGTIVRSWETGPWVNDKPAIGLELSVSVGNGAPYVAVTKERLPNFHLLVGLLQPGVELPILVAGEGADADVSVDWEVWELERAGEAIPEREPAPALARSEPSIGDHVVDGVRRPVRVPKVAVGVLVAAAPLIGGLVLWLDGNRTTGLILAMVGALLLSFIASTIVVGVREGITWREEAEMTWPDAQGTAEVLEVWMVGRLGYERVHGFVLRVHAGARQWEVKIRQAVPRSWLQSLRPGLRVAVRADPDAERRVAIDWEASTPPA